MIDHVRANNKACIVKRKGGGLPDREFDSVRDAAVWCRETGRSTSSNSGNIAIHIHQSLESAYGFTWELRSRRWTRHGGGLPDEVFDSIRDAADWCRETGRSKARPKLVIASIATRVFCGFIWTAEHVSSDDSVDRELISGDDAALPSLERADSVSASHDKTLTVRDIIDRTSEEVEKEKRDIADLQRKLEERQWFLQQLEDYTSPHEYD